MRQAESMRIVGIEHDAPERTIAATSASSSLNTAAGVPQERVPQAGQGSIGDARQQGRALRCGLRRPHPPSRESAPDLPIAARESPSCRRNRTHLAVHQPVPRQAERSMQFGLPGERHRRTSVGIEQRFRSVGPGAAQAADPQQRVGGGHRNRFIQPPWADFDKNAR